MNVQTRRDISRTNAVAAGELTPVDGDGLFVDDNCCAVYVRLPHE